MAEIGECVSPMKAPLFLAPDLEFYYLLLLFFFLKMWLLEMVVKSERSLIKLYFE